MKVNNFKLRKKEKLLVKISKLQVVIIKIDYINKSNIFLI